MGHLSIFEAAGDDLGQKWAGIRFPTAVNARPGETVIFSFILFKSKAHRDSVNAKVTKDPLMSPESGRGKKMPFDMKRMMYGGFKVLVEE